MGNSYADAAKRDLPISEVRYLTSVDSTNAEAKRWLITGAPNFSLVFADEQTEGRGRLDRKWITKKGAAIAASLILAGGKTEIAPSLDEIVKAGMLLRLTALGTLAIQSTLKEKYQLPAQIKWPNDVIITDEKVAGVLVETIWRGDKVTAAVIGMGVNVQNSAIPDERYLHMPATSIESKLGKPIVRTTILQQILESLFDYYPLILKDRFISEWEQALSSLNKEITITYKNDMDEEMAMTAVALGLADNGELIVQTKAGKQIYLHHGDLRIR